MLTLGLKQEDQVNPYPPKSVQSQDSTKFPNFKSQNDGKKKVPCENPSKVKTNIQDSLVHTDSQRVKKL